VNPVCLENRGGFCQMDRNALMVKPFAEGDGKAWDDYVRIHPSATVFHRRAWSDAVEKAYGHRPIHGVAWSEGRLVGLLPLFFVKSVFVGRVLVSVPYATYGGIVADSDEIAKALLTFAEGLSREYAAEYLELRHRDPNALGLPEIGRYDTFRKELPQDPDEILTRLPRKTRAATRKGIEWLGPDAVAMGPELLDTIYDLYAVTLKRLGSPNYRRRLLRELLKCFGEDCVCLVVRDNGTPVAGVVSYVFRDEIVPYFSGSLEAGMAMNANNVMYLRLMEYAIRRGLRWFDFNRTRRDNSGPYDFKRHHGFEPTPLHYQVSLNRSRELPNLSPSNRRFALAGRIWRKLPLWMTRAAGGRITKWIP